MSILKLVEMINPSHVILDVRYDFVTYEAQPWAKYKSRTAGICDETHKTYVKGTLVFKPLGRPANREQRLLPEALVKFGVPNEEQYTESTKPAPTTTSRVITFPDTWKPNKEGMRKTLSSITGVKSSMNHNKF